MKDKDKAGDVKDKAADFEVMPIHDRRRLLAAVAGQVAAGIMSTPSPSMSSADKIATTAVDVAEAILRKTGLH